jgi:hypothetical protein
MANGKNLPDQEAERPCHISMNSIVTWRDERRLTFCDIAHLAKLLKLDKLYILSERIDSCSFDELE